jgi:hypothetical protein
MSVTNKDTKRTASQYISPAVATRSAAAHGGHIDIDVLAIDGSSLGRDRQVAALVALPQQPLEEVRPLAYDHNSTHAHAATRAQQAVRAGSLARPGAPASGRQAGRRSPVGRSIIGAGDHSFRSYPRWR